MPTSDDAFVQNLSRLAADVAPTITVDTSRVVSTGRRRRDRRRSVAAGAFGIAVLGGVAFAQTSVWTSPPQVAAHETFDAPLDRSAFGVPTSEDIAPTAQGDAPNVGPLSQTPVSLDVDADDAGRLPVPAAAALGALGAWALATGAYLAVRSRRHPR